MFAIDLIFHKSLVSKNPGTSIRHRSNGEQVYLEPQEYKSRSALMEAISEVFPESRIEREDSRHCIIEVDENYEGKWQLERVKELNGESDIEEIQVMKHSIQRLPFYKVTYPNAEKSKEREYISDREILKFLEGEYETIYARWAGKDLFLVDARKRVK